MHPKKCSDHKVISLKEHIQNEKKAEENLASINSVQELIEKGRDPLHALYLHTQNWVNLFVEELSPLPQLHAWHNFSVKMSETYYPDYPPMSPITKSFPFLPSMYMPEDLAL